MWENNFPKKEDFVFPEREGENPPRDRPWNNLDSLLKFILIGQFFTLVFAVWDLCSPRFDCLGYVIGFNLILFVSTIIHLRRRKAEKNQQSK